MVYLVIIIISLSRCYKKLLTSSQLASRKDCDRAISVPRTTEKLLNRLIRFAVASGAVTALTMVIHIAVYYSSPQSYLYTLPCVFLCLRLSASSDLVRRTFRAMTISKVRSLFLSLLLHFQR